VLFGRVGIEQVTAELDTDKPCSNPGSTTSAVYSAEPSKPFEPQFLPLYSGVTMEPPHCVTGWQLEDRVPSHGGRYSWPCLPPHWAFCFFLVLGFQVSLMLFDRCQVQPSCSPAWVGSSCGSASGVVFAERKGSWNIGVFVGVHFVVGKPVILSWICYLA
jgi:hypothetical protein